MKRKNILEKRGGRGVPPYPRSNPRLGRGKGVLHDPVLSPHHVRRNAVRVARSCRSAFLLPTRPPAPRRQDEIPEEEPAHPAPPRRPRDRAHGSLRRNLRPRRRKNRPQ